MNIEVAKKRYKEWELEQDFNLCKYTLNTLFDKNIYKLPYFATLGLQNTIKNPSIEGLTSNNT